MCFSVNDHLTQKLNLLPIITNNKENIHMQYSLDSSMKRDDLVELIVDGKKILKWIF
jgi:hypothetical protein